MAYMSASKNGSPAAETARIFGLLLMLCCRAYYAKSCQEWVARYEAIREQHALSVNALKKSAEDTNLAQRVVETDKIIDLIIHTSQEEIKRYDEFKIKEIIHWTRFYAKIQIDAHKAAIETWEKFLKNFK